MKEPIKIIPIKKLKLSKGEIAAAGSYDTRELDTSLDVEVWTDKDETKLVPCRECGRGCIVTQFAAAAKVACSEHRGRRAKTDHIHTLAADKEPHVLTDKEDTKTVPCRHCGRPCVVTRFASAAKVACLDCRKSAPKPKTTTTYTEKPDGTRVKEVHVEIADEHQQEWQNYVLERPGHFDAIYTDAERTEKEEKRLESLAKVREARAARTTRQDAEWALADLPDLEKMRTRMKDTKGDARKKLGEQIEEVTTRRVMLEATIDQQEGIEKAAELAADEAAERSNRLGRIGYLRGALDAGYRIEITEDHHRYLVGNGERRCKLPHDYLDSVEYREVENAAVAA